MTLAAAVAAGRGPLVSREADPEPSRPTGARWTLSPAALTALVLLVALAAAAGWWLSRPAPQAVAYAGTGSSARATPAASATSGGADEQGTGTATQSVPTGLSPAPSSSTAAGADAAASASSAAPTTLEVHVTGAVRHPGLVTVPAGARVADAVAAAGGLRRTADQSSVNLARPLVDGEQVVVGRRGGHGATDSSAVPASGTGADGTDAGGVAAAGAPVDLNTASADVLDTLPGIGPALAGRIIDWREQNGGFTALEQLMDVSGIGEATYGRLHDLVTL